MNHLPYDAFNGSLVEQVVSSVVGKKDPSCKAIMQLAIGKIRPQEDQATDDEDPWAVVASISADILYQKGQHSPAEVQQGGSAALCGRQCRPLPQQQGWTYNPYVSKKKMKFMMAVITSI